MSSEAERARARRYHARNAEKIRIRQKAYREKNRERLAARRKELYEANIEEYRRVARERMRKKHKSKPMAEHLREKRAKADARHARIIAEIAARPPKPTVRKKSNVPEELLRAYSGADRNSIIRRKWPTKADMVKHFEEAH